jgi:ABC-type uncharacterized transport system YnjBCD substrate-binding protein
MAVPSAASHPNAGRLFLNFVLTKAGQATHNGNNLGGSPISGIKDTLPVGGAYVQPDETIPQTEVKRIYGLLGIQ